MLSFNSRYSFYSLIIVIKSARLISIFINALDILISMLFNLLLANIRILLCFFFSFRGVFNKFFTIPVKIENATLELALSIPAGATVTVKND